MSEPNSIAEFAEIVRTVNMADVGICLMWMADGQVILGSPNGSARPAGVIASLRFLADELEAGRGRIVTGEPNDG